MRHLLTDRRGNIIYSWRQLRQVRGANNQSQFSSHVSSSSALLHDDAEENDESQQQQQHHHRHHPAPPPPSPPPTLYYKVQNREWEDVIRRAASHPAEVLWQSGGNVSWQGGGNVNHDHHHHHHHHTSRDTCLHCACRLDPPADVVNALRAASYMTNSEGLTPLHVAASHRCSADVIKVLLLQPSSLLVVAPTSVEDGEHDDEEDDEDKEPLVAEDRADAVADGSRDGNGDHYESKKEDEESVGASHGKKKRTTIGGGCGGGDTAASTDQQEQQPPREEPDLLKRTPTMTATAPATSSSSPSSPTPPTAVLTRMGRAPIHYACMSFRGLDVDAFRVLLEATLRTGFITIAQYDGEDEEDDELGESISLNENHDDDDSGRANLFVDNEGGHFCRQLEEDVLLLEEHEDEADDDDRDDCHERQQTQQVNGTRGDCGHEGVVVVDHKNDSASIAHDQTRMMTMARKQQQQYWGMHGDMKRSNDVATVIDDVADAHLDVKPSAESIASSSSSSSSSPRTTPAPPTAFVTASTTTKKNTASNTSTASPTTTNPDLTTTSTTMNVLTMRDATGQTPLGLLFRRYRERVRYVISTVERVSSLAAALTIHADLGALWEKARLIVTRLTEERLLAEEEEQQQRQKRQKRQKRRRRIRIMRQRRRGLLAGDPASGGEIDTTTGTTMAACGEAIGGGGGGGGGGSGSGSGGEQEEEEEEAATTSDLIIFGSHPTQKTPAYRQDMTDDAFCFEDGEEEEDEDEEDDYDDELPDSPGEKLIAQKAAEAAWLENGWNPAPTNTTSVIIRNDRKQALLSSSIPPPTQRRRRRLFRIVHASVGLTGYGCPPEMIRLALSLHPEQAREMDEDGNLPLHIAASAASSSSFDCSPAAAAALFAGGGGGSGGAAAAAAAGLDDDTSSLMSDLSFLSTATACTHAFDKVIRILLHQYPSAARIPNGRTGKLPLVMSFPHRTWEDGIKTLLNAYPAALHARRNDIPPSLYPNILARIGGPSWSLSSFHNSGTVLGGGGVCVGGVAPTGGVTTTVTRTRRAVGSWRFNAGLLAQNNPHHGGGNGGMAVGGTAGGGGKPLRDRNLTSLYECIRAKPDLIQRRHHQHHYFLPPGRRQEQDE